MDVIRPGAKFVGSILLVLGAILIRTYLRILDYSHSYTSKDTTTNNFRWILHVVHCVLTAVQKIIVYRSILFIFTFGIDEGSGPFLPFCLPVGIILLPRILFSVFLVAANCDYNRHRETNVEKRKVNMSTKFATMWHKCITTIFSVLHVRESTIVIVLERVEYVLLQLLGHNYSERVIASYSETESILTLLLLFRAYLNSGTVTLYLTSSMFIYALRIGIGIV